MSEYLLRISPHASSGSRAECGLPAVREETHRYGRAGGHRIEALAKPRLLDRVRTEIRKRHYSPRTEEAYLGWIRRFILFHDKRHPETMGAAEVEAFLSYLATRRNVAASTQNQALAALLFLYKAVLGCDLEWLDGLVRARRPARLPVVLSRDEVRSILDGLEGAPRLMAFLMYGAGLRLLECCRLRIKDIDFGAFQLGFVSISSREKRRAPMSTFSILTARRSSGLNRTSNSHRISA